MEYDSSLIIHFAFDRVEKVLVAVSLPVSVMVFIESINLSNGDKFLYKLLVKWGSIRTSVLALLFKNGETEGCQSNHYTIFF